MLRANVSLHNAELESYRLEVLAGEQSQVDNELTYMKIFLSCISLQNAELESTLSC